MPDFDMKNMDRFLGKVKAGLVDSKGVAIPQPKPPKEDGEIGHCGLCTFDHLMALFDKMGIPRVDPEDESFSQVRNELRFSVDCPRDGVIFYNVSAHGYFSAWFGKSNSDSGGLSLSGTIPDDPSKANEQTRDLLKMHKRFLQSGRRKVIRNYRERRRKGRG